MGGLLLLLTAQALTIDDICAEPSTDPESPGTYCFIDTQQHIETEHYSLTIEPPMVVLFYDEGRVMEVMPSIRQSPILIGITVDKESVAEAERSLAYYNCPGAVLAQGALLRCERIDEEVYVSRKYAGLRGAHVISVGFSRSPRVDAASGEAEKFERMLQSIRIKPLQAEP